LLGTERAKKVGDEVHGPPATCHGARGLGAIPGRDVMYSRLVGGRKKKKEGRKKKKRKNRKIQKKT
jgi:hypothetical protein